MVTMVPPDTGAREGEAGEGESSGSWGEGEEGGES